MSKKKKQSVPVAPPKQEKKMVIDMNAMNLKKEHAVPGFKTGRHMTGKEPGRYNSDTRPGSFVIKPNCHQPMD